MPLNAVNISGADMSSCKSDFVTYEDATLMSVKFIKSRLCFSNFCGSNLSKAVLYRAAMIGCKFSGKTYMQDADVNGAVLLLAKVDGKPMTKQWLKGKGAKNSDQAITNISELAAALKNKLFDEKHVDFLCENINNLYGMFNSTRIRVNQGMFFKPEWKILLPYSTVENLNALKAAYFTLLDYKKGLSDTNETVSSPGLK